MPDLQRLTDKFAGVKLCDMTSDELQEFIGGVAKRGAYEALQATGLNDESAGTDVRDLRDLLKAFRVLKKAAWTQTWSMLGRIIGWMLVIFLLTLVMNSDRAQLVIRALK